MIHPPKAKFIGLEDTAIIGWPGLANTDPCRDRAILVDDLFERGHGWHSVTAVHIVPGLNLLMVWVGWAAGDISSRIRELTLVDCPCFRLTRRHLVPVVIVGPPASAAIPPVRIARNKILLRQIASYPIADPNLRF